MTLKLRFFDANNTEQPSRTIEADGLPRNGDSLLLDGATYAAGPAVWQEAGGRLEPIVAAWQLPESVEKAGLPALPLWEGKA